MLRPAYQVGESVPAQRAVMEEFLNNGCMADVSHPTMRSASQDVSVGPAEAARCRQILNKDPKHRPPSCVPVYMLKECAHRYPSCRTETTSVRCDATSTRGNDLRRITVRLPYCPCRGLEAQGAYRRPPCKPAKSSQPTRARLNLSLKDSEKSGAMLCYTPDRFRAHLRASYANQQQASVPRKIM